MTSACKPSYEYRFCCYSECFFAIIWNVFTFGFHVTNLIPSFRERSRDALLFIALCIVADASWEVIVSVSRNMTSYWQLFGDAQA